MRLTVYLAVAALLCAGVLLMLTTDTDIECQHEEGDGDDEGALNSDLQSAATLPLELTEHYSNRLLNRYLQTAVSHEEHAIVHHQAAIANSRLTQTELSPESSRASAWAGNADMPLPPLEMQGPRIHDKLRSRVRALYRKWHDRSIQEKMKFEQSKEEDETLAHLHTEARVAEARITRAQPHHGNKVYRRARKKHAAERRVKRNTMRAEVMSTAFKHSARAKAQATIATGVGVIGGASKTANTAGPSHVHSDRGISSMVYSAASKRDADKIASSNTSETGLRNTAESESRNAFSHNSAISTMPETVAPAVVRSPVTRERRKYMKIVKSDVDRMRREYMRKITSLKRKIAAVKKSFAG